MTHSKSRMNRGRHTFLVRHDPDFSKGDYVRRGLGPGVLSPWTSHAGPTEEVRVSGLKSY